MKMPLYQRVGDPSRRRLSEGDPGTYRRRAVIEDDEAGMGSYDRFKELFDTYSKQAGKEQYLIPYFISAHPGRVMKIW
ncbi:hypothetical protein ACLK1S_18650 [Escherichia coli]